MNGFDLIEIGDPRQSKVCLTFDDGPNPYFTGRMLGILDMFGVKASFFLIGRWCEAHPELVLEIDRRGHLVGNHTHEHGKGSFSACDAVLRKILGRTVRYVRPPYYDLSYCEAERGFCLDKTIVTGDVNSEDYLEISPERVVTNVMAVIKGGSIVCLHDGSDQEHEIATRPSKTVTALERLIPALLALGLTPVRVDELKRKSTT